MPNVRILLVDDHQMFRDALRCLLEKTPHFKVVGETGDAFEVLGLAHKTSADIVCMDIGMPGMNGIETTRHLLAACPSVKVIALSTYSDQRYVKGMMNVGALAYITKVAAADELFRAINAARKNRKYLSPDVADEFIGVMTQQSQRDLSTKLSNRERQVLQLVAEGHTSAIISDRLNIALSTVEVHRRNIMRKLNLHSIAELTRYAIRNDISAV